MLRDYPSFSSVVTAKYPGKSTLWDRGVYSVHSSRLWCIRARTSQWQQPEAAGLIISTEQRNKGVDVAGHIMSTEQRKECIDASLLAWFPS